MKKPLNLRFIVSHWLSAPTEFVILLILVLLTSLCDLAIPWGVRRLLDLLAQPQAHDPDRVWGAWALLSGLFLGMYVFRSGMIRCASSLSLKIMAKVTANAFARIQSFSHAWHISNAGGGVMRGISNATWGYNRAFDGLVLNMLPTGIVVVGMIVSIALYWPAVAAFAAVVVVAGIVTNAIAVYKYVEPMSYAAMEVDGKINATIVDALGANALVKGFAAEAQEERRLHALIDHWKGANARSWMRFASLADLQNAFLFLLQMGLIGLMIRAWSQGVATAGDVGLAVTACIVLAAHMRNFNQVIRAVKTSLQEVTQVARYMQDEPEIADPPLPRKLEVVEGHIEYRNVGFSYRGQADALFDGLNLKIKPRERIGIVGASGSGKSTLLRLLQRLYDVDCGEILIDGQSVKEVSQFSLRRAIAVVPQESALLHRSIRENIAYGKPQASLEEIIAAAKLAHAHDFISGLAEGYDSVVGERGTKLSGGERQRIGIARAMLTDAPIVILDEATSALDLETECAIQLAFDNLMRDRTTIVVAHRLSSVNALDRIIVIDGGRIVEDGIPSELIQRNGFYSRLSRLAALA